MVAEERTNKLVIDQVGRVYEWLGSQIKEHADLCGQCEGCGKCCDFDNYDHRLFVTAPEVMYFKAKLGIDKLAEMAGGVCPYNEGGKCSVYAHRFAVCRAFFCGGDKDFQGELIEKAIRKFKDVSDRYGIEYRYGDLKDFRGA